MQNCFLPLSVRGLKEGKPSIIMFVTDRIMTFPKEATEPRDMSTVYDELEKLRKMLREKRDLRTILQLGK